jgi:3D (Asp-Asp-Asp) domain-containing protein
VFEGCYYQQVFGTAMGSPVSAVIANLVMEDVEQRALASVPVSLSFWKRFVVDDVISAVSRNEIDILLQHLNSIEPSIQFTVEREIIISNTMI